MSSLLRCLFHRQNVSSGVGAANLADPVRQFGACALRAAADVQGPQRKMGPVTAVAGFGAFSFRKGSHQVRSLLRSPADLEPDPGELVPSRVRSTGRAFARPEPQLGSARGADSGTVLGTQRLHRQVRQDILRDKLAQIQNVPFVDREDGVARFIDARTILHVNRRPELFGDIEPRGVLEPIETSAARALRRRLSARQRQDSFVSANQPHGAGNAAGEAAELPTLVVERIPAISPGRRSQQLCNIPLHASPHSQSQVKRGHYKEPLNLVSTKDWGIPPKLRSEF